MLGAVVAEGFRRLGLVTDLLNAGVGMQDRRQTLALRQREVIAALQCRWASTGLFFLIHNLLQAAVLEHDALARLHPVSAAVEDAGDQHVRRIAGARPPDKDAEVGGHEDIGVAPGGEACLDSAMVDRHQKARNLAGRDARVGR